MSDKRRHDVEPKGWPRRVNGLSSASELRVYTKQYEKLDTSIHIFIFSFRDPEEAVRGATNRRSAQVWGELHWHTAAEIGGVKLGNLFGH
jgi:hypothetical protein